MEDVKYTDPPKRADVVEAQRKITDMLHEASIVCDHTHAFAMLTVAAGVLSRLGVNGLNVVLPEFGVAVLLLTPEELESLKDKLPQHFRHSGPVH